MEVDMMDSRINGPMPAAGSASQGARPGPVTPLPAAADPPGEDGRELVGRLADAAEIALALPTLSRPQRQAIELAYFGRLSQREIAEHLRVPTGTIKARAARGPLRARQLLTSARA
jgi:DNA-directed RNA polymerase specialized sigma24 family protein